MTYVVVQLKERLKTTEMTNLLLYFVQEARYQKLQNQAVLELGALPGIVLALIAKFQISVRIVSVYWALCPPLLDGASWALSQLLPSIRTRIVLTEHFEH